MRTSGLLLLAVVAACGELGDPAPASSPAAPAALDAPAFDVVVVGSGPGGIAAAIQAARMHRSVVLIEPSGHVGGQLLTVTSMDETRDNPPERREGIYAEFAEAVVEYYADHDPPWSVGTCLFSDTSLCYEAAVGEEILRRMLMTEGVQLHPGSDVVEVLQVAPNQVGGVVTADGLVWTSRIVIDATEYGDLLPLAGAAYRVGNRVREPGVPPPDPTGDDACVQETTYTITIREFASLPPDLDVRGSPPPGGTDDYELHAPVYRSLLGPVLNPSGCPRQSNWKCHAAYRGTPDRDNPRPYVSHDYRHTKTMVNALNDYPTQRNLGDQGLPIAAVEDRAARRVHDCAARMLTTQFIYFAQQQMGKRWAASDEMSPYGLNLDHCAQFDARALGTERLFPVSPYVREGRRVIGVRTVTGNDILRTTDSTFKGFMHMARRSWATSLMLGYYGNDLHGCWDGTHLEADLGDEPGMPTEGGPYQLPFGAFIPRDIDGLLVAEKNLSMSRLVNAAARVQPAAMTSGMAAGAIAALATEPRFDGRAIPPRSIPPVLVQDALLASRTPTSVSLFTYDDVLFDDPRWGDVQLASTHGVLIGLGGFQFGATQALSRAQAAIALQRTFRYPLDPPSTTVYDDLDSGTTLWRYAQAMTRVGLTMGCATAPSGNQLFCPTRDVLRRELMVWIVAALQLHPSPRCTTAPYDDVDVNDPICPFWELAKGAGLAVTCSENHVCPGAPVTRADTTAFTRRAMLYMAREPTSVGACYRTPPEYCDP